MTAERTPGSDPGRAHDRPPEHLPRLDADGKPVDEARDASGSAEGPGAGRMPGPSPLPPVLLAVTGAALTVWQLAELLRAVPAQGQALPMTGLVLAAAVALGGFSMARVLQLLRLAAAHRRRRLHGEETAEAPRPLADAHSLHAIWVVGVGGSISLMGLLGVWSLLDGRPSGLEPGWPLLLIGAAVALVAHLAAQRTTACWEGPARGF
ncbi:hypothetical protein ACT3SP_06560 [Brachybacterium sp. AOP43-C2-M15]|uniref:hypothetical protein n=1 Tax=Brachybacterium sp. AOP43-C2-M15 TaxID=3457661 RepID=UPI00403456D4